MPETPDPKPTLASAYPELAAQWHPTLNGELTPDEVAPFSAKKPWWLCEQGHEWDSSVANRAKRGDGCPYCSGRRIISGYNDFATLHPDLAAQWHPTLNTLDPTTIAPRRNEKAWWLCPECSHEWEALIPNRHKRGCPVCAGRVVKVGYNDLATTYPELAAQWHPTRNGDLTPETVTAGRALPSWWRCATGHEWSAVIYSRAKGRQGCPYCAGRYVVAGLTGLTQTHPHLLTEWDKDLNTKTPDEVKAGSHYRAHWKCASGHLWTTSVKERTRPVTDQGKGPSACPDCWAATGYSKAEEEIATFITSLGVTTQRNVRGVVSQELDIYIPTKKIAIEYNGIYWHSELIRPDKDYHQKKWQSCQDAGIQLIQIWEDEWLRNPTQVKQMLAHKLDVPYGEERRVMARKTTVATTTKQDAEQFFKKNHIQGYAPASHYLALTEKSTGDTVAMLALKREAGTDGKTLNIIRYATSAIVPGGFTKLLTYAERTYQPEKFITFSDHCVSDGGLYRNNGFVADKELPPDYMYVVRNERKHKFGYRLKRFRNDPNLKWEDALTERELAQLNGLHRIWDAGKTRWVKTLP